MKHRVGDLVLRSMTLQNCTLGQIVEVKEDPEIIYPYVVKWSDDPFLLVQSEEEITRYKTFLESYMQDENR